MSHVNRRALLAGAAAAGAASAFSLSNALAALPVGAPAPEWHIAEWVNSEPFTLASLRGQVVVISFFQLWCPSCNSFSIPLTLEWEKIFADEIANERMKIVSIHTVFEGHNHQTIGRLKRFVAQKGFGHPVGHDRHDIHDHLPNTLIMYGTGGTPEMAIIDPEGRIAFQKLGRFDVADKERLIRSLLRA